MASVCIINKLSARAFGERKAFDNDSCLKLTCVTFSKSNKTSAKLSFSILLIERMILLMKISMSITKGKGSINHNRRKFISENVDKERVKDNVILLDEDIKTIYDETFGDALDEYNSKQTRKDRKIKNYYEHISRSKQEKPFNELIIQLGNKDNPYEINEISQKVLKRIFKLMQNKYKSLVFVGAYIHNDEHTPHIHIDYIPVCHNQKRGLSTRVSHNLAMKEMGFDDYTEFRMDLMDELIKISNEYGLERDELGNTNKHLSVREFKEVSQEIEMAQSYLSELEQYATIKNKEIDRLEYEIADLEQNKPFYIRLLDKALMLVEKLLGMELPSEYEACETILDDALSNSKEIDEDEEYDMDY